MASKHPDPAVGRHAMTAAAAELQSALLAADGAAFDPFTGTPAGEERKRFRAAELGLEAPRYCPLCGRRLVTQVLHTGWTAKCSRHGTAESEVLDALRESARDPLGTEG